MRITSFFLLLILCFSCNQEHKEKEPHDQNRALQDTVVQEGFDEIPDHASDDAIAAGIDPSTGLPEELSMAIESTLPGWRPVLEHEWVESEILANFNGDKTIEAQAIYENNIFLKADFDGDALEDFAVFLRNEAMQTALYILQKKASNYHALVVQKINWDEACCFGSGLELLPAGNYAILNDENKREQLNLPHNGIKYLDYQFDSAATIYYITKGGTFQKAQLID